MFFTHLRIALVSLKSTRVRTALTTLGVLIGVLIITLVLALGEGAKQAIGSHLQHLHKDVIVIRPGKAERSPTGTITDYNPLSSYAASTITERDLTSLEANKQIAAVAPIMLVNGSVKDGKKPAPKATIVASTPALMDILELKPKQGQFLDGATADDTIVIGEQLSIDLFGTDQSIGRLLKVRGQDFTIIGVIKKVDTPLGINGVNINQAAIVSLEVGKAFNQGIAQIQQVNIVPKKGVSVEQLRSSTATVLVKNHEGEEDFSILAGKDLSTISSDYFQTVVVMTTAIAAVSLLVGGIGIMNIMLVSVTERTREVGIRKSLGASNQQIFLQFLIESLLMSALGGFIGFILAYGISYLASMYLAFAPVFTWQIFALAMGLAITVGVVFGLFPAMRAAAKDPIHALRQYH